MSVVASFVFSSLVIVGQASNPDPDELDILRSVGTQPQVELVLDTSGSMAWGQEISDCSAFPANEFTCWYTPAQGRTCSYWAQQCIGTSGWTEPACCGYASGGCQSSASCTPPSCCGVPWNGGCQNETQCIPSTPSCCGRTSGGCSGQPQCSAPSCCATTWNGGCRDSRGRVVDTHATCRNFNPSCCNRNCRNDTRCRTTNSGCGGETQCTSFVPPACCDRMSGGCQGTSQCTWTAPTCCATPRVGCQGASQCTTASCCTYPSGGCAGQSQCNPPVTQSNQTACSYFRSCRDDCSYETPSGARYLNKADQLKAALTGCHSTGDGLLDQWTGSVNFSTRQFGGSRVGTNFEAQFGSTLAQLETSVFNLPADGMTPMAPAYRNAGLHMHDYFTNNNTQTCRQNYIVLMTDGVSNGGGATFNYDCNASTPDVTVNDASPPTTSDERLGAAYLRRYATDGTDADILCNVNGIQPIRTYTIGFGAPGDVADESLRAIARNGDGMYYPASNYEQLSSAFASVIGGIVARSPLNFGASAIETDGLYSANYVYTSAFKSETQGRWSGTTRKYCIVPDVLANGDYDVTSRDCMFTSPDGETLLSNPLAVDQWSRLPSATIDGTGALELLPADQGGSGAILLATKFGGANVGDPPPSSPYQRAIYTWTEAEPTRWVPFTPTDLTPDDTWSSGPCGHRMLVNAVHGYGYEANDCTLGDYAPVDIDWPLGGALNAPTVLVKYSASCEAPGDKCYVVTGTDDGQIHFYDAITGLETSAVVPGEFLTGLGRAIGTSTPRPVANHLLSEIGDQPAMGISHRFYVDGGIRLVHVDTNGNSYIDSTETAYLIVGLGRGGQEYILMPMQAFDGVPTNANLPKLMSPMNEAATSPFYDLRDTWSSPWVGYADLGGATRLTAAFGSGHIGYLDRVDARPATLAPGHPLPPERRQNVACNAVAAVSGANQQMCNPGFPGASCNPGAGIPCYDGAWNRPPWMPGPPYDFTLGPMRWQQGSHNGIAFRVEFNFLDLQANDYVYLLDGNQQVVQTLGAANNSATAFWSSWIYDSTFSIQFKSNGIDSTRARGWDLGKIDIWEGEKKSEPPTDNGVGLSHPTIYVVDLDTWATGGSASHRAALRLRFTKDCQSREVNETCVDATTATDLQYMTCPITAELAAYTEGGLLQSLYVGDECGQIWKAWRAPSGWTARRLLALNSAVASAQSKDYRKIFTKLDLALSQCNGSRSIGVYFGTGNVQRAAATDGLANASLNSGRDVMGVVWDSPNLPARTLVFSDLENVTNAVNVLDPKAGLAVNGYVIELAAAEKMLRDPLVYNGVAFFKTYAPTVAASECTAAAGTDSVYAFDNCTAKPLVDGADSGTGVADSASDRRVWSGGTDIGSGLQLFTPKNSDGFVSVANMRTIENAVLPGKSQNRRLRLWLWRYED